MSSSAAKLLGQFYSPEDVAECLVKWLAPAESETLLDPSCGDGRFLSQHKKSIGVDSCKTSCQMARMRAPHAEVHQLDFFEWSQIKKPRFTCIAGNPPFIRYQNFTGATRRRALDLSAVQGAKFSALTSSWAPFLVVSAGLLNPGGRMAFVVPAEIGHANYSSTLLDFLTKNFEKVVIVAIKEKIFPELSEDVWLLGASGKGGTCKSVELRLAEKFLPDVFSTSKSKSVPIETLRNHRMRLRRFLLPDSVLDYYQTLPRAGNIVHFGEIARVGIGYVTGANDFFHLRPSEAERLNVPASMLRVAVRKGDQLSGSFIDKTTVNLWLKEDRPVLFLDLAGAQSLPPGVISYLNSEKAAEAKITYKCRTRDPWFVVPDVYAPDAFLSYMSGVTPNLVGNLAKCVCTNSVHAVRLKQKVSLDRLVRAWRTDICRLSIEIEGHPLGGGLFKIEPGEATRILLPVKANQKVKYDDKLLTEGIEVARSWRHCV
jgi:adenine-specific DNA-methyltransferase